MLARLRAEFPEQAARIAAGCKGLRGSTSLHGLGFDEIKSSLQKYARRGEFDNGLRVLLDAECFALAGPTHATAVKGIRSNVVNRMVIMAVEDCMEPRLLKTIADGYASWKDIRDSDRGFLLVVNMYEAICRARKGRYVSIVKVYARAASLPPAFRAKHGLEAAASLASSSSSGAKDARAQAQEFERLLGLGDMRCCCFLRDGCLPDGVVWDAVFRVCGQREQAINALESLERAFPKDHRERRYFLYLAVFLAVHRQDLLRSQGQGQGQVQVQVQGQVQVQEPKTHKDPAALLEAYRAHLASPDRIVLDPYCIDMHTAKGRRLGRGQEHFATVGALVTNENTELPASAAVRDAYKAMYAESKLQAPDSQGGGEVQGVQEVQGVRGVQGVQDEPKKKAKKPKTKADNDDLAAMLARGAAAKPCLFGGERFLKRFASSARPEDLVDLSAEARDVRPLRNNPGSKPMTISAVLDGERVVLKQLTSGLDLVAIDACKAIFGLRSLGARLVVTDCELAPDTHQPRRSAERRVFMTCELVRSMSGAPAPMVTQHKDAIYADASTFAQYVKIGLFRGLFRATDFCTRNVLVAPRGELVSIDENNAGSSKGIFRRKDAAFAAAWRKHRSAVAKVLAELRSAFDAAKIKQAIRGAIPEEAGLVDADIDRVVAFMEKNLGTLSGDAQADVDAML